MAETLLQIRELKKSYGSKTVLSDIDFSLEAGDILGYIGPNGAGKTTTMKIICGLCKADSGVVLTGTEEARLRIGVVFDHNGLYPNLTAKENLQFFLKLYNTPDEEKELKRLLEFVGLSEAMNQKVKHFSKGMARRLVLARAFVQKPDLLIMDEPFDGLDVESQYLMRNFLEQWAKKEKHGILFTSHNMKEVQDFCNRIVFIKAGRITLQGAVDELLQKYFRGLRIHLNDPGEGRRVCELLAGLYQRCEQKEDEIFLENSRDKNEVIMQKLMSGQISFCEIAEVTDSLEDIYIREMGGYE